MSKYRLIADHGLIGNLQTAALVATDGTIEQIGNFPRALTHLALIDAALTLNSQPDRR